MEVFGARGAPTPSILRSEQACPLRAQTAALVPSLSGLPRELTSLGVGGFIAGLVAVALTLTGGQASDEVAYPVLLLLVGWGCIGCGLFALWHRAGNRIAILMTAVGFCWFLGTLAESDVESIHNLGLFVSGLWSGVAVHG
jgi:hypothetical protein